MVQTQLLEEKISASGLRPSFIVEQLGISKQAFHKKKNNLIKFRVAEVYVVSDLLRLTADEKKEIFFADEVNK